MGKGAAIGLALASADTDVIRLIDGDMQYFGKVPLVMILTTPILHGRPTRQSATSIGSPYSP